MTTTVRDSDLDAIAAAGGEPERNTTAMVTDSSSTTAVEGSSRAAVTVQKRPHDLLTNEYVEVQETNTSRGRGVFALRDLPQGLTISRSSKDRTDATNIFTPLASMRSQAAGPDAQRLRSRDQATLRSFIKEYSFEDPKSKLRALVYPITSHFNHACDEGCSQAVWKVTPNDMTMEVTLRKGVAADEEIFISYNRPVPFTCASCGTLNQTKRERFRYFGQSLQRSVRRTLEHMGFRLRQLQQNVASAVFHQDVD
ncbi:hypothetical protein F66182_4636 [Fusarium sp. NRRL 66182]|nr:hypothetical protein F66182_4636 [Fusarium sp. NRRL 66182]